MRNHEMPKGPLSVLATVLFFAGLALSAVFHGTGVIVWIGILLMVAGVGISITLLFVQRRTRVARHRDGMKESAP